MKLYLFILSLMAVSYAAFAQVADSNTSDIQNIAQKLLSSDNMLVLGGYGEIHYNQPLESGTRNNGSLDVHRMVMTVQALAHRITDHKAILSRK